MHRAGASLRPGYTMLDHLLDDRQRSARDEFGKAEMMGATNMQTVQEIEVHADANAKTTVCITFHADSNSFGSEVVILDQISDPLTETLVDFGSDFQTAGDAFEAALHWIAQWSADRDLPIIRINNPYDCDLISVDDEVLVARRCGVEAPVTATA